MLSFFVVDEYVRVRFVVYYLLTVCLCCFEVCDEWYKTWILVPVSIC